MDRRVRRIEAAAFYVCGIVAFISLTVGLFSPFLNPGEKTSKLTEPLSLVVSVFELPEIAMGHGPFMGNAHLVGWALGVYSLVAVLTVIALVFMLSRFSTGASTFAMSMASLLLLTCLGAWVIVLNLASRSGGGMTAFSPAVALISVGAILSLLTSSIGRYIANVDEGDAE